MECSLAASLFHILLALKLLAWEAELKASQLSRQCDGSDVMTLRRQSSAQWPMSYLSNYSSHNC